ncbi:MAG: hypothetical protein H6Q69_2125 [Firmicutes bacterium]|nr:hypothetical protein [Bacillota bacterium]
MRHTKAISKKMRELSNQAYERELRKELENLAGKFTLWQENELGIWDLEEAIHQFHNGAARELYKRYTMTSPELVLPYALYKNIIAYEELPEEIADEIKMRTALYRNNG